jgi:hypothetical protein
MANPTTWESTDPRDAGYDRAYSLVPFDKPGDLRGGFWSILYVLAIPKGRIPDAEMVVDRVITRDVRTDARRYVAMLNGEDGHDRDQARNLRNRLALIQRQYGDAALHFAVHYSDRLPTESRAMPKPSPEMLRRVRHSLLHEEGFGNHYWRLALTIDELPPAPHSRMVLGIVGIDAKGRINGSLPRPNHHQLDRWFRRDLRQLVQACIQHPTFPETVRFAEQHGLTLAFLWRRETPRGE